MNKHLFRIIAAGFVCLSGFTGAMTASGQGGLNTPSRMDDEALDIETDELEYSGDTIIAKRNVVIRRRGSILKADQVTYNVETENAVATGNVTYEGQGRTWEGDSLRYNFRTHEGDFGSLTTVVEQFSIQSESSQQVGKGHYYLENVLITTCSPDNPEFHATARSADIYDKSLVRAEHVVFRLRNVPVMYMPSYTIDLNRENTNLDFLPGYSSRSGAYALTAYTWHLNEALRTTTHLDYRSKRGLAGGQDFFWKEPVETGEVRKWRGGFRAYYAQDDEPYKSTDQEERQRAEGLDIDEERYRLRLSHTQIISEYETGFAELNYMSDREVTKDFFTEEFRLMPTPENRLSYVYNHPDFIAGLEVQKILNEDLYTGVDRMPEARFEVPSINIRDTPLYYDSLNTATFLEQNFNDFDVSGGKENYDAGRFHTSHTVRYPKKYAKFLNVIPRLGYTGTYYTDTAGDTVEDTEIVQNVDTNGVITLSTNTIERLAGGGSDIRNLPELGVATSFKAFRELTNEPIGYGKGLRHVAEPRLEYTFIPEPDLRASEIFQFDNIDRLDRRNDLLIGYRNKLQTKMPRVYNLDGEVKEIYTVYDIIDFDLYSIYRLDPEDGEEDFANLFFDLELRPFVSTLVDVNGEFNHYDSELERVNTQVHVLTSDRSSLTLDHTYRRDRNNVVQAEYELKPQARYSLEGYSRYEIDDGEMEEQGLLLTMKTDCVGYGIGGRWLAGDFNEAENKQEEDEYQVYVQIWLLAFPGSELKIGE